MERAQSVLFEHLGFGWSSCAYRDPDLNYVVKELHIEFQAAFTSPGLLPVEIIAERIGATSAWYGFRCGHYAIGYRDREGRCSRPARAVE